jgi:hypothetical protein
MTAHEQWKQTTTDPLGLSDLEPVEPGYDGWAQIETALREHQENKRKWRLRGRWMAAAASLVLVLGITLKFTGEPTPVERVSSGIATQVANDASVEVQDNINALIGISQNMEEQVKKLRQQAASMPAESAVYVAELEDLIAQVDRELSLSPGSIDLWGQRVNLMLDLAQIYQQQWQIDYGRMASL